MAILHKERMLPEELRFAQVLDAKYQGVQITGADEHQNKILHFDMTMQFPSRNGKPGPFKRIEFKGMKGYGAHDPYMFDLLWIEWQGNEGHKGWVRAQADDIAFEMEHEYLIVPRAELEHLVEKVNWEVVDHRPRYKENAKTYKCYGGRPDKSGFGVQLDSLCLVPTADVLALRGVFKMSKTQMRKVA